MSAPDDSAACFTSLSKRLRIEAVLTRIRPLLQMDGVDIELVDVRDDGASVRMTGLCVLCGTAPLNFHTALEEILREDIDGFGDLRLATDADGPHS